jgi:alcohol dehydrogenase class IV
MNGFDFECIPRLISGDFAAARLADLALVRGMRRPLIVTDRPLLDAGVLEPALWRFEAVALEPVLWPEVQPDPPEGSVRAAVAAALEAGIDGVIGFGGGSSMDTAKLVALLAATRQPLEDTYGVGLAKGPRLPLIQVPTTAGTGSEVTPIAIVTTDAGEKKGVVSSHLYADIAVLDPTLTVGLPPRTTAMTGVDAMVHAIEAYTSRQKKNMLSDTLAHRALSLLSGNLRRVLQDGTDLAARRAMLQGSMLAGMAFANAPVGAVHALAYPLGGLFHVPHGQSNALVLVPVLAFNAPVAGAMYGELARDLYDGETPACAEPTAEAFIRAIAALVADMPFEQRLRDVGVTEADLPALATDAMKVQRLLVNNPRELTYDDALAIYRAVY